MTKAEEFRRLAEEADKRAEAVEEAEARHR